MFKKSAREPLPSSRRHRALWQGAVALACAVTGLLAASWLLNALGLVGRGPCLLVFFLGFAALIYAVWKLGVARDGRWDGWGLLALALLILGYPLLFLFSGWSAMALYSVFTGQPVRLYGD